MSGCAHCGLPTRSGDAYCCYGCELAARIAAEGAANQARVRASLTFSLLLSMIVMTLALLIYGEDVYPEAQSAPAWFGGGVRWMAGLASTPVLLLLGPPLLRRAWRDARSRRISMDLLIVGGAAAAYVLSIASLFRGGKLVYFDSAVAALILATLGRYLEASARAAASKRLAATLDLATEPVIRVRDGEQALVPPALVESGDRLRVEIERVLPVDAIVETRPVEVRLGVLTGEADPVTIAPGQPVPAGAVPISDALECTALRTARDSTLERLGAIARELQTTRSPLQRLSDRFASALTPTVWILAAGSFVFWWHRASVDRGVVVALAVVLAACPCTYGVTAPLALWLALRRGLDGGVSIRTAEALERFATVKTVAFDKTGTLTDALGRVVDIDMAPGEDRAEALAIAAALERGNRHPAAAALCRLAERERIAPTAIDARQNTVGRGVVARDVDGSELLVGSARFARERGVAVDGGDERIVIARAGRALARVRVGEALRPEARAAMDALGSLGIDAVMVTGDADRRAHDAGAKLGIAVLSGRSPSEKVDELRRLGERVAMVGDGLNDMPALADVPSFAMEGATGLARGIAQATLLRPDLRLVPWTLALARRTIAHVRAALAASTLYNVVFLALAAAGALRPVWAGVSMLTSSLILLASTLGVASFRAPPEAAPDATRAAPAPAVPGAAEAAAC